MPYYLIYRDHYPNCSDLKLSSRQNENNLSSNQVKIEDWISSDMDPSKSKGTVCMHVSKSLRE